MEHEPIGAADSHSRRGMPRMGVVMMEMVMVMVMMMIMTGMVLEMRRMMLLVIVLLIARCTQQQKILAGVIRVDNVRNG